MPVPRKLTCSTRKTKSSPNRKFKLQISVDFGVGSILIHAQHGFPKELQRRRLSLLVEVGVKILSHVHALASSLSRCELLHWYKYKSAHSTAVRYWGPLRVYELLSGKLAFEEGIQRSQFRFSSGSRRYKNGMGRYKPLILMDTKLWSSLIANLSRFGPSAEFHMRHMGFCSPIHPDGQVVHLSDGSMAGV